MSIDRLQKLLEADDEVPLQILPSGEIVELPESERKPRKVLTMRENLGGEYGQHR
jgi:hypothetical protein